MMGNSKLMTRGEEREFMAGSRASIWAQAVIRLSLYSRLISSWWKNKWQGRCV